MNPPFARLPLARPLRRLAATLFIALGALPPAEAGDPQEPGFTETVFTSGLPQPTSFAWAPDGSGRLFVALKERGVWIVQNGAVQAAPFASFSQLYTASECGVLGVCFDPDYVTNRFVYVFVTVSASEQRIYRFTDVNGAGAARTTIIGGLPTLGSNHDGGALGFGPDGKLYWAIGDLGAKRGVDSDLRSLAAKVGRANADGSAPADNPFHDGAGPNNDFIWATGFRNPFTLTFHPRTGQLWLNVVGSTPGGQTEPNSGPGYEQVFALRAGDDGGYDDYEGNQPAGHRYGTPFVRPFAHPVIQYKTATSVQPEEVRNLTAISRSAGVATFTTNGAAHPFRVGQAVRVSGAASPAFDGIFTVRARLSASSFTALAAGPDASSGGGNVRPLVQGSSIGGGCFYDSSAFPESYREDFFYCDYTGGRVMRARLDAQGRAADIQPFLINAPAPVDTAVGPDGALYYAAIGDGTIRRIAWTGAPPDLILTPSILRLGEGGAGAFMVRLGAQPSGEVTVETRRASGDADLAVASGEALIFTPANWSRPQAVTIAAALDADSADDEATFSITAAGLEPELAQVSAKDESAPVVLVSTRRIEMREGEETALEVSLPSPPSRATVVSIRRTSNSTGALASRAALIFTPANFATPQTVRIIAGHDANRRDERTRLLLSARGYALQRVDIFVADDDPSPPRFTSIPKRRAVVGLPFSDTAAAHARPAATFSLTLSPPGMTIDPATGAIAWTPPATGAFLIAIRAHNGVPPAVVQRYRLVVAPDRPPSVFLTAPQPGATVSGASAEFFGSASDDYGAARGEFRIDGALVGTDVNRENHFHLHGAHNLWDTTLLPNGPHTLRLTVFDDQEQSASAEVTVTVANP